MNITKSREIGVREFNGRWYLYWNDTKQTIASFESQFDAYSARRSILKTITIQR